MNEKNETITIHGTLVQENIGEKFWNSFGDVTKNTFKKIKEKKESVQKKKRARKNKKTEPVEKNEVQRKQKQTFSVVRLSMKEQTFFAKRLSFLTKAGVPVLEGLHMIREQTLSKGYAKVMDSVIFDVSNGQYLSTSLSKFKNVFGEFAINIISVGESTGTLSENLEYLAEELRKKQALRRKVVGAFVYPLVVTFATFGITAFLIIYLFPKIMPVFTSLHVKLPLSTRIIIALSELLRNHGIALIIGLLLTFTLFMITLKRNYKFHFIFDRAILRIPILGQLIAYYNLANMSRTLGLLLKSGLTLSEAIPITEKTTTNLVYKNQYKKLNEVVNRGEKISNHLKTRRGLFPDTFSQIIAVGERSGNLPHSFTYISELYEAEVDDFTKNLSGMIEPALMIIMGVLVGFIAISIITPIYGITQNIHP